MIKTCTFIGIKMAQLLTDNICSDRTNFSIVIIFPALISSNLRYGDNFETNLIAMLMKTTEMISKFK